MSESVTDSRIKEVILQRAESFALHDDEETLKSNEIRMKAPMIFVFLGDKLQDGISKVQLSIAERISNSEGIVYLAVGSASNNKQSSDVLYIELGKEVKTETGKDERQKLSHLLEENDVLKQLNEKIIELTQCVLGKSKVFSYWEQIHVTMVTAASDPLNIILPDLTVLIKNKLEQSFKQVFTDLFVIVEETSEDASPMNKALSYSFFQELERYQESHYHYEKPIELLDEEMKLIASYDGALFHLIYLLMDKKENGQKINDATKKHYETMVAVNLLKNREQLSVELEEVREQYNYNTFMASIKENADNRYCTARLAKVRKPGQGIYLTIAYYLFKAYEKELSYEKQDASYALLDQVGLSDERLEKLIREYMPPEEGLEEIKSLISRKISFKELKNVTFFEAEQNLYGDSANDFFERNFIKSTYKKVISVIQGEAFREKLIKEVVSHPSYGPFVIGQLLNSEAYESLENQKEKYQYKMREYMTGLEEKQNQLVGQYVGGNFSLFEKKYVQEVKEYIIKEIYRIKYHYALENLKLQALQILKEELEQFYETLKNQLQKLKEIEEFLLERIEEANRYEEDYLVQNVKEYYEKVVAEQLEKLKKLKGEHFLQEEKYMGLGYQLLGESKAVILEKICQITEQEILKEDKYFKISFEEELLNRANMLVDYEETEVVSKSELYKLLYESLEENSMPCVHLDTTLATHRYVEKYFLGNRHSEFIDYAYKRDQSSRSYKIGTVSDTRNNVIEKLQLMGGFKLEDLIYTRSARRYYEAYKEKGYHFHSEDFHSEGRREIDGDKTI